jgi:ribonuclease HII
MTQAGRNLRLLPSQKTANYPSLKKRARACYEPNVPDFSFEKKVGGVVAGVDEVGRGPWAGPVVAAAVILNEDDFPDGLDDSKKLTKRMREQLYEKIREGATVGIGQASVEEIDALNILQASLLAMRRAIVKLGNVPEAILVDGNKSPDCWQPVQCIVKGDSRSFSIAAASIVAKVTRDRIMQDLALTFPAYGWERNAGYGTAEHRDALFLVGISPHHRKSFAPIRKLMTQDNLLTS